MEKNKPQPKVPNPLEPHFVEMVRTIEHGVEVAAESAVRTEKALEKIAESVSNRNGNTSTHEEPIQEGAVIAVRVVKGDKGEKGDTGKDADEEKIAKSVTESVLERFPKTEAIVEEVVKDVTPRLAASLPTKDEIVEAVRPLIKDGEDGEDSDPAVVASILKDDPEFIKKTKGAKGDAGKDGSPDSPEKIVEKVKGKISYNDLIDRPDIFKKKASGGGFIADMADVNTAGLIVGQVLQWNGTTWVPYTPISAVNSLILQKTSGTIDDSNLAFVFGTATAQPTALQINGVMYLPSAGAITWTWNAATKTATLSSAVGVNGTIFGIV